MALSTGSRSFKGLSFGVALGDQIPMRLRLRLLAHAKAGMTSASSGPMPQVGPGGGTRPKALKRRGLESRRWESAMRLEFQGFQRVAPNRPGPKPRKAAQNGPN